MLLQIALFLSYSWINNILGRLSGKEFACQCTRPGFDPWVRKILWRRKWQPTQYSCLGNPMDRGAWWATVHGVAKELDTTWWLNNKKYQLLNWYKVKIMQKGKKQVLNNNYSDISYNKGDFMQDYCHRYSCQDYCNQGKRLDSTPNTKTSGIYSQGIGVGVGWGGGRGAGWKIIWGVWWKEADGHMACIPRTTSQASCLLSLGISLPWENQPIPRSMRP